MENIPPSCVHESACQSAHMITFEIIVSPFHRVLKGGDFLGSMGGQGLQVWLRCFLEVEAMTIFVSTLQEKTEKLTTHAEDTKECCRHALMWHQLFVEVSFELKDQSWGFARDAHWGQGFQAPKEVSFAVKSFNMNAIQVRRIRWIAKFFKHFFYWPRPTSSWTTAMWPKGRRYDSQSVALTKMERFPNFHQFFFTSWCFLLVSVMLQRRAFEVQLWKVGRRMGAYASSIWHQNTSLVVSMFVCLFWSSCEGWLHMIIMLLIRRKRWNSFPPSQFLSCFFWVLLEDWSVPNFQSFEAANSFTAKDAALATATTATTTAGVEIFEPVWFDDASIPTLCDTSQARTFKDLTDG